MNLLVIGPFASITSRLRALKVCNFFHPYVDQITHWSWIRHNHDTEENTFYTIEKKVFIKSGNISSFLNNILYFYWILKVFAFSFFIKKDTIVWAIGFESAFPLLLASKLKKFNLIFDDADRFSMLVNYPNLVKLVLKKLEKTTSLYSFIHIIPNKLRYNFVSPKFFEMRNMPSTEDIEKAMNFNIEDIKSFPIKKKSQITIYCNGLLNNTRGAKTLARVALSLLNSDFKERYKIIVAGPIRGKDAEDLIALPNVTYLGKINHIESLAIYKESDFVFTYYCPSMVINQYAESNKWGDALSMGVGIIANSEIKTVKHLSNSNCAVLFEYNDAAGLFNFILSADKSFIDTIKTNSKKLGLSYKKFDENLSDIKRIIFKESNL